MIILKLKAGLGNQLFQYAYARALTLRSKTDLIIDISWFSNIDKKDTPRTFLLNKYNLPVAVKIENRAESWLTRFIRKVRSKINRDIFKQSDYTYYPRLARPVSNHRNTIVEGFWNTEKYFVDCADAIRHELTLKVPLSESALKLEQEVRGATASGVQTILIHVRRGDYVTNVHANTFNGLSGAEYYKQAIERMRMEIEKRVPNSKIVFFLASDDVSWLKENIIPLLDDTPYYLISGYEHVSEYEELHIMSLCHHFIIANSTFSWWSAWLSNTAAKSGVKKLVIGPKRWVANQKIDTRDVMPEEWIRI